jgi:hypothetical protein
VQRRFLGDAKDSFKWDYHDYLAGELGYGRLTVAFMTRPDGTNTHGQTPPEDYPSRDCIIALCRKLRATHDPLDVLGLPTATGGTYRVEFHQGTSMLTDENRRSYFKGLDSEEDQLVFLDPDNGFEPKGCTLQHVRYSEVREVLDQVSPDSLVSVFQHFRRKSFVDDFRDIRQQLGDCRSTAIYWRELMFVGVTRSDQTLEAVIAANASYAKQRPVKVIT